MLKQWQAHIEENPVQGWRLSVAVLFLVFLALHRFIPSFGVPSLSVLLIVPTTLLLLRLSAGRQYKRPLAPDQLHEVGVLSIRGAICSLLMLSIVAVSSTIGMPLPLVLREDMIHLFGISLILSLIFGYVALNTRAGRWGLGILGGWLALMMVWAIVTAWIEMPRG